MESNKEFAAEALLLLLFQNENETRVRLGKAMSAKTLTAWGRLLRNFAERQRMNIEIVKNEPSNF